jgi:threonine dehydrogenase-like Zn-dependent dehydrogenase
MKAITFDAAIPKYVLTLAAGKVAGSLLTGAGRTTRLAEVREPALPGPRWVRVRTILGGICGSDLQLVRLAVSPSTSPFSSSPFVIGHENVGVIAEVGPDVSAVRAGDRVVANPLLSCEPRGFATPCPRCAAGQPSLCENFTRGAIAPGMLVGTTRDLGGSWGESFVAHESQLHRVPSGVSDSAALLLEPFASALHPVLQAPPEAGAEVLVIGAGSIGLLCVAAIGAIAPSARVTVLARYPFQAEEATRLGAAQVVLAHGDYYAQLARLSGGVLLQPIIGRRIQVGGFDATYVCVGNSSGVDDALRFTRSGGRVVLIGNASRLAAVDWSPVWLKELTLRGSVCYGVHAHGGARRDTFAIALDLFAGGLAPRLERLLTHRFPLAAYRDALALAFGKARGQSIKIAFEHR